MHALIVCLFLLLPHHPTTSPISLTFSFYDYKAESVQSLVHTLYVTK